MSLHALLLSLAVGNAGNTIKELSPSPSWRPHQSDPTIEVWTNREEVVHHGERVRVYFRSEDNAYVAVFRVDTDGRIRALFPRNPWDNHYARGGRRYEIMPYDERPSFVVDEDPGEGYLLAVASRDPLDYRYLVSGVRWDYQQIGRGGRIVGDPYVALMDLIDLMVPPQYVDYDYDIMPYYVEQRFEYPRFLCYDCHSYARYRVWDPYRSSCARFRIVVYNDPYYYPARSQPGTRVVFTRPRRLEPRYVFRDRVRSVPYVEQVAARPRPTNDPGGRRLRTDPDSPRRAPDGIAAPRPEARDRRAPDDPYRPEANTADRLDAVAGVRRLPSPARASQSAQAPPPADRARSTPRRVDDTEADAPRRGAGDRLGDETARPRLQRREPDRGRAPGQTPPRLPAPSSPAENRAPQADSGQETSRRPSRRSDTTATGRSSKGETRSAGRRELSAVEPSVPPSRTRPRRKRPR